MRVTADQPVIGTPGHGLVPPGTTVMEFVDTNPVPNSVIEQMLESEQARSPGVGPFIVKVPNLKTKRTPSCDQQRTWLRPFGPAVAPPPMENTAVVLEVLASILGEAVEVKFVKSDVI
jgi:hypothetical protein